MADGKSYQILELVAQGGTAVLYKAMQTSLDRVVAVKKLHHHLTEDENFTRRFILEAKAAASLDHDNIVKIIDFGVEDDDYFMVMEFIEGESLRDILDRWKQIPEEYALAIAYQVCLGLEHAHSKGIVHRDIKPGNIMLTKTGRVKVTDFGLAKLTQAPTQHTAANSILGTPLYMSPEQAFGESVDQRSDLFSLGTMLYESLTGQQPFLCDNYMGVIQNIINNNAPHPSKFGVELASGTENVVLKSMNKNREGRFQSAGQFKKAIEKRLGLESLKESSENLKTLLVTDGATMVLPRTQRAQRKNRRFRKGLTATIVAAAIGCAATVGYIAAPGLFQKVIRDVKAIAGRQSVTTVPVQQSDMFATGLPGLETAAVFSDSALATDRSPATTSSKTSKPPAQTANIVEAAANSAHDKVDARPTETVASTPAAASSADSAGLSRVNAVPTASIVVNKSMSTVSAANAATEEKTIPPTKVVRTGWLSVTAEPPSEIYVDGLYVGDSPEARIKLERGEHTLECRRPRFETYREVLNITTGELSTRNIVLQKIVGRISLSTIDGAEVYVDGNLIGVTPLDQPIELETGQHQVTVKKAGFHVWNNNVTLDPKQLLPLKITLSPIY